MCPFRVAVSTDGLVSTRAGGHYPTQLVLRSALGSLVWFCCFSGSGAEIQLRPRAAVANLSALTDHQGPVDARLATAGLDGISREGKVTLGARSGLQLSFARHPGLSTLVTRSGPSSLLCSFMSVSLPGPGWAGAHSGVGALTPSPHAATPPLTT